jgi:uroporphyrinogen-III synthase
VSVPRVALTTTSERVAELADLVTSQGLQPVSLPCVEVVAAEHATLEEARAAARAVDWLIVTSPRTVMVLWPNGGMPDVPVAAVGARSAAAVVRAGGSVAATGEAGADSLLDGLTGSVAGRQVLWAHGLAAEPSTAARLRDLGAAVTDLVVFETRSIPPRADAVDAALFASPSAVAGWVMGRGLDGMILAAIGATTAAALAAEGHPPDVVPARPEYPLMIEAVAQHLSERSPL